MITRRPHFLSTLARLALLLALLALVLGVAPVAQGAPASVAETKTSTPIRPFDPSTGLRAGSAQDKPFDPSTGLRAGSAQDGPFDPSTGLRAGSAQDGSFADLPPGLAAALAQTLQDDLPDSYHFTPRGPTTRPATPLRPCSSPSPRMASRCAARPGIGPGA